MKGAREAKSNIISVTHQLPLLVMQNESHVATTKIVMNTH